MNFVSNKRERNEKDFNALHKGRLKPQNHLVMASMTGSRAINKLLFLTVIFR